MPFNVVPSRADAESAHHASAAVGTGLVIFMIVAGLAGLVALAQTVRRNLAQTDDEGAVLVALGARRFDRALAGVFGALPYLAVAPLVAAGVAYLSSPLFPLGSVRALEPHLGLRADPAVLIFGAIAWLAVLVVLTLVVAWVGSARVPPESAGSARFRLASVISAPRAVAVAIGARFGLQPGARRRALRRTAFAGLIVAVTGVVASVVFVRSLDAFTQAPARYGIGFDLVLELPTAHRQPVLRELAADRDLEAVASSAESGSDLIQVGGRSLFAYAIESVKGSIVPSLHSGRLPANDNEIAIGPKLLDELGDQLGDQVELASREGNRKLTIVGTVYSPTSESAQFNEEAVLTPGALARFSTNPTVNALLRVRPGVPIAKVFDDLDARFPYAVSDESFAHAPGPVRNLEQIARLPLALALFFAFFGAAALAQSTFLTAREQRRDLAVLRGLGFRRRQVVVVLLGAASSVAAVSLLVGIPLGVLAGRVGWSAGRAQSLRHARRGDPRGCARGVRPRGVRGRVPRGAPARFAAAAAHSGLGVAHRIAADVRL